MSAEFAEIAAKYSRCFWLDGGGSQWGARGWQQGRSVFGWLTDEDLSLTYQASSQEVRAWPGGEVVGNDIFQVLADLQDGDADTHWVGYFGYATRGDLSAMAATQVPDAVWMRTRNVKVIDVPTEPADHSGAALAQPVDEPELPVPAWYAQAFSAVQAELRAGNSYEVNLTYRETITAELDPVAVYQQLRRTNPAPYAGFLQHEGVALLSSSPERYATIDRNRVIQTRPIKGTTPRGETPKLDAALKHKLATDPKFRAENLMITDLLRNDIGMVAALGSVQVPDLMQVESYASVHQLVSTIQGSLRPEVDSLAALKALFPAGSMTGAPKRRTMEIIDQVETTPRGLYSGAFGWISGDGRADLGVIIRSLINVGNTWTLGTGGGITIDSKLEEEWQETRWKSARLRAVLHPK